ncbi:MAG: DUF2236 domain-containing protein [Bacteroidetes bacterium]|nr:MAG: DUF2236 domain-containing protein [Bacteroidota bacterium]
MDNPVFVIPTPDAPVLEQRVPGDFRQLRSRKARTAWLAALDPVSDHELISYLLTSYEFSWDTTRALELALFRVFGVAKGSPLLVETGEFTRRTQKRYDDTVLILSEILENGYDSPRGKVALRRMNDQHRRFPIPNDEFLYTLSTFIFEPIRWNTRFGWRPLSENEKQASYIYWYELGKRMNIKDIPESYEAFERYNIDYERTHFAYSESNHALAVATRNLLLGWVLPRFMQPVGAPFVHALIDDPLLQAVGLPSPPRWLRQMVEGSMRLRATLLRFMPLRHRARLLTRQKSRSYPQGYSVQQLGAHP